MTISVHQVKLKRPTLTPDELLSRKKFFSLSFLYVGIILCWWNFSFQNLMFSLLSHCVRGSTGGEGPSPWRESLCVELISVFVLHVAGSFVSLKCELIVSTGDDFKAPSKRAKIEFSCSLKIVKNFAKWLSNIPHKYHSQNIS